ncbi:MAG: hypothetical protein ACOC32_01435 [Nanoarchaeota archaeon]
MQDDDYADDSLQEAPEEQMDNDEISPEEEGFMKGYEDEESYNSEFDMNSDSE